MIFFSLYHTGGSSWIGLHCPPQECASPNNATWTWMDKSANNYTNWHHDPFPGHHCAKIGHNQGTWFSAFCHHSEPFICEREALMRKLKTSGSPIELTTPSSNRNEGEFASILMWPLAAACCLPMVVFNMLVSIHSFLSFCIHPWHDGINATSVYKKLEKKTNFSNGCQIVKVSSFIILISVSHWCSTLQSAIHVYIIPLLQVIEPYYCCLYQNVIALTAQGSYLAPKFRVPKFKCSL